ncbi:hypothetical protein HY484_01540, partial [Candidatus Woesearchaeota archaeon]|nr:hypothetical protein [Candidatus Woesearchaeota archaeon]
MKKAQITIYIILGLILMISIAIVSYVTQKKELAPTEVIHVPEEAKPVHEFVTSCLTQIAQNAVVQLGLQGGYLYIPREIERTPTSYLSLDAEHKFKLPYWYYEGQDRTPNIEDLQNQLDRFLRENNQLCTSFEKFEPAVIEIIDDIKPQTIIGEETVTFTIKWPMLIKISERTTKIENFAIQLPVKLKQAWQLANNVMQTENKIAFFENRTIDFMSSNENTPTDGLIFECGVKKWHLDDIKKELQEILYYNLPRIRVSNTQHTPYDDARTAYQNLARARTSMLKKLEQGVSLDEQKPPTSIPDDAYEYFKMTLDAGNAPTKLKTAFSYLPEWGMMIAAQPADGKILKTNMAKGIRKYLPFLCINQWHFTYDIIYPVKLVVKDETAFLNKGYIFQIAFPIIINNNAPERVLFGVQKFKTPVFYEDFCGLPSENVADIRAKGFIEDLPIAVELKDANITYQCFTQACELGLTKTDEGAYRLRTQLPQGCSNPIISASKEGYLPAQDVLTSERLDLLLTRLKKMKVKVVVHSYNPTDEKYIGTKEDLMPNQKVSIRISLRDKEFDQYKEYPRDTEIELVEGKASYDIDALLMSNDVNIGGYIGEAVNISYSDIADKDTIVINVVEFKPHPINQ